MKSKTFTSDEAKRLPVTCLQALQDAGAGRITDRNALYLAGLEPPINEIKGQVFSDGGFKVEWK